MKRGSLVIISVLICLSVLGGGCVSNQHDSDTKSDDLASDSKMMKQSKEIVAQNVLSAQLAKHNDIESRNIFSPTEPIYASVYLTKSQHIEPRRISAFLMRDEIVIEEQSVDVGTNETRQEFDFSFTKTPRQSGEYKIRFVEIKRSSGKPVLLARLFLNVEDRSQKSK